MNYISKWKCEFAQLSSAAKVKSEKSELMGATQEEDVCEGILHSAPCAKHSQHSIRFSLLLNEQNQILFLFKEIVNLYSPPPHIICDQVRQW